MSWLDDAIDEALTTLLERLGEQYVVIPELSALVRVEGDDRDYVATLVSHAELSDIFGAGATPQAAVEDLMETLESAREHLHERRSSLSERLLGQYKALCRLHHERTWFMQESRVQYYFESTTALPGGLLSTEDNIPLALAS